MQFHNPNDTIHVPPQDILEDLLEQVDKLQAQVDELKRLQYSNSSNARDVFLYGCELAGSQYLDLEDHVVPKLHENDPLALMREPNNEFDEHAISVYTTGGLKLGYLPKSNNLILSRLMDEGNLLFGKTKTFHWDGKRLYLVVKVYMRA